MRMTNNLTLNYYYFECELLVQMMIYHNSRFSATISRRVALHRSKRHGYCVSSKTTDTLIIGGGPIGLSTAYHLATNHCNNDGSSITVIERDPTYASASATLSAGGIRQQVSLSCVTNCNAISTYNYL